METCSSDMETIKGDNVRDSVIGGEVTTVESKVFGGDKRCFCTVVFTASLPSFNSFLESSSAFV